jgi:hypothetical protein
MTRIVIALIAVAMPALVCGRRPKARGRCSGSITGRPGLRIAPRTTSRVAGAILLVADVLVGSACSGCGLRTGALLGPTVPVKGKITYKGKPLTHGEIIFQPVSGKMFAHGTIKADGTFQLTTDASGDGAVVGAHRVNLSHLSKKAAIPAEHVNPFSQKLEVEVVEGKSLPRNTPKTERLRTKNCVFLGAGVSRSDMSWLSGFFSQSG